MRAHQFAGLLAAGLVIAAISAGQADGSGAPPVLKPTVALSKPVPGIVRVGDLVTISGRVLRAPSATRVALQYRRTTGWRSLASAKIGLRRRFTVRWRVAKTMAIGPASVRVVALKAGAVKASSAISQIGIGSARVPCRAVDIAVSPPATDGWIIGGMYIVGGPFPGIDACSSQPYTITATDSTGTVAATANVAAGSSYDLALAPGSYTLTSGFCRGSATVVAGRITHADTICPVP